MIGNYQVVVLEKGENVITTLPIIRNVCKLISFLKVENYFIHKNIVYQTTQFKLDTETV